MFQFKQKIINQKKTLGKLPDSHQGYADLVHSELVAKKYLHKPESHTLYMPMHGVVKEASTTTKLRIVCDASAKTSTTQSNFMIPFYLDQYFTHS